MSAEDRRRARAAQAITQAWPGELGERVLAAGPAAFLASRVTT